MNVGEEQLVRAWKEEVGGTMWDARLVEEEMVGLGGAEVSEHRSWKDPVVWLKCCRCV